MPNQIYYWKRFWCPRTGSINLSDGGYLFDPESQYGQINNPDVVPFKSLSTIPCLVLLGEPGIGKTYALAAEREVINVKIEKEGDEIRWFDLRAYRSEDRLVRDLFENSVVLAWRKSENRFHLFLDSLDECLLRIDTLYSLLLEELKKLPIERLSLRLACRTADWQTFLENGLTRLWGEQKVGVYELVPLRKRDVIEAAKANDLIPEDFLQEIDRMEAVPLAFKPVTLNFLLNTYRQNGNLPPTQKELYLQGCTLLCEETNESRRATTTLMGTLSARQRLAVAARIAALTIFTNRYAVWTGVDLGKVPEEDVTIASLCGGRENVDGELIQVTETAVKETLRTGLFSSRGPNRLGWAHQTYAEFLAAHYLIQNKMTLTQMLSLFIHPGDPQGKIVPQLYETGAWLAGMLPGFFREVIKIDPEMLLRSDVGTADRRDQVALVESLLGLYDEEKSWDRDWDLRKQYRKLNHPDLADQLRPYICDVSKETIVRRVAINIAEACKLKILQNDLLIVALDSTSPLNTREEAASAVSRIGDEEIKAKLKPLAWGEAGDDPDDELKVCGLRALWSKHITVDELFSILTYPKRDDLIGAYWQFLSHDLVQNLDPQDLPRALKWVEQQKRYHELPIPFRKLMDSITLKAWDNIEIPGVTEAFAEAALSRLKHYDDVVGDHIDSQFRNMLIKDDDKRHQVLKAIVPKISNPEKDSIRIVTSSTPLAMSKDVPWMIEQCQKAKSKEIQTTWAHLINRTFDWREPIQLEAIIIASQSNPIMAEVFTWLLKPIELGSPEAMKMKQDLLERQKWQERDKSRPSLKPSPAERIVSLLEQYESGNTDAWWRLNIEMTLEPNSMYYESQKEIEPDLTVLPGWKTADTVTRARIVAAAKKYIFARDPETHKWLGENTMYRPAYAGYRAFRLLLQEDPSFITIIPIEIWKKWAPITLIFPTWGDNTDEKKVRQKLIALAYAFAPDEIIKTLMVMIDKENKEHDHIFITTKVEHCWDNRLANALLIKAKDTHLKPECMGYLLGELLDHKMDEARSFAESLILLPLPFNGETRTRAIVAARELMIHADNASWLAVWPAIQQDTEFGRDVVEAAAHSDRHELSFGQLLTEDQLANLYIWVVSQYPYADDPKHEGTHWVGPRESIAIWRDSILHHLQQRGTSKACEAILRIAKEFPDLKWLKWTLMEAQNITRRKTWVPPQPSDILKLAHDQQARLIQNGEQLLDVLIESLQRLEEKLHSETPAAQFLWDKIGQDVYRPKDENSFSDYVKIHLDDDIKQRGIIVNREVQIHRKEKTDIHVDAIVKKSDNEVYDSITAIIEVKGCWNPDSDHAMKSQLVEKYLKNNCCQHGLYLVGWFNCDKWDKGDYRKGQAQALKLTKDEAQKYFDAQAVELSQGGTQIKAFVINTALQ